MESQALATLPGRTPEPSDSARSIKEWLFRFGVEHNVDVAPRLPLWLEVFGEMESAKLEKLFRQALQRCKFFPKIAEILAPIEESHEEQTAADLKWTQVLDFVRRYYWADVPGCIASGAPRISDRTMTAIRAAGGIAWIADCDREQLVWCKKAFIESYTAWAELERNEYLLPADSPVRELLSGVSEKLLPPSLTKPTQYTPSIAAARLPEGHPIRELLIDVTPREGAIEVSSANRDAARIAELERRLSVAENLAAAARTVIELGVSEAVPPSDARLTAMNAQAETLQAQAATLKQRFPTAIPDSLPESARRFVR
jgi:hypothetical protein